MTEINTASPTTRRDKPFPLLTNFMLYVLPLLMIGALGLAYTFRETVATSIEAFHAQREVASISGLLLRTSLAQPESWRDVIEGRPSSIQGGLSAEIDELGIFCLILLRPTGQKMLTVGDSATCKSPALQLFSEVPDISYPILREDIAGKGLWTVLAKISLPGFDEPVLAAISRASQGSESTIGELIRSQTIIFGVVIASAIAFAVWLVLRAQQALNASFEAQRQVQRRMQRLISRGAATNSLSGSSKATKHDAVVMFVDLRNFSGFAEMSSVEDTAGLVDSFVTVVTSAVQREGGDVDKFLGDGVLAWFEGKEANVRSIRAAAACIEDCRHLPRHPGVGLCRGEIIAALLGEGERADFTILGRSVNLASRLCSVSGPNEISAPVDFADIAEVGLVKSGLEEISFKNHRHPISVSKFKLQADSTQ